MVTPFTQRWVMAYRRSMRSLPQTIVSSQLQESTLPADRIRTSPEHPPSKPTTAPQIAVEKQQPETPPKNDARAVESPRPASPAKMVEPAPQSNHSLHRPHIHRSQSAEKPSLSPSSPKNTKDSKPPASPSTGRRGSWITSLSSKFSSSTSPQSSSPNVSSHHPSKPLPSPLKEASNPMDGTPPSTSKESKKLDPPPSPLAHSPKSGQTSFIQSALRRLSSSGASTSLGKASGTGGVCPRRVMNIDPHRERCQIEDLQPAKLRRVSFCVDVEIAATAAYDDRDQSPPSPPPFGRRASLTQLEHQVEIKKRKEKNLKGKSEGEALKNPQTMIEKKEQATEAMANGADLKPDQAVLEPTLELSSLDVQEPSRKKEKKKRSEEERKQRKERKRQEAIANGTKPAELPTNNSNSSGVSSPGDISPSRTQDRPTTDPLRIYRRCCQLRETSVLKRVAEQVASPSACDPSSPGTISCLDLSGFVMQLQDIVTIGDYLAVVPVKKLMMEDCGLTDEALRVILAGLLAAKTPEQVKHNKHLAKMPNGHHKDQVEQTGVIEKLSLKNNPKVGRDGWKYLALFIHMSMSIKAIDLSMIPFPQPMGSANGNGSTTKSPVNGKPPVEVDLILQKALAERPAGPRLEELVMAECGLNSLNVDRLVTGVIQSGATRLGLASNNLDIEALQSVTRYVRTGKCEGLDLGGNDLSNDLAITILAEVLDSENALYALSLADCNLSPSSLKSLFPALVRLNNFRFIDLSHNRNLFATQPDALSILRKYLPQMTALKRVHLADVALSPEHAIALAEVLPECVSLAHLNILENPQLSDLASAKDETSQQEACALYASLMAAVRVSHSIICIDVDVPSNDNSEVVKALAKQVVAYSLRNMERGPVAEAYASAAAIAVDEQNGDKIVAVPDILLHLVGQTDNVQIDPDKDEPAPDDDYIVGGTGVVKALGICLGNKAADYRRSSRDVTPADSGSATPKQVLQGTDVSKGKAKDMSKNLLGSARKIRARLQPALNLEARDGNNIGYSKPKSPKSLKPY